MKKTFNFKTILPVICLWGCSVLANAQNFDWAKNVGGSKGDEGHSVAVDNMGNIYITGQYGSDTVDLSPGGNGGRIVNASPGSYDVFLAKYDAAGNFLWVKSMGGVRNDYSYGVAVDHAGNVYIGGYFRSDTADFNRGSTGGIITTTGLFNVYLAKYDMDGHFLWAKSIGGKGNDQGYGVAVDGTGNVYVTGSFSDTVSFSSGSKDTIISTGARDVFIAKYNPSGNFLWAKSMGGNSSDYGRDITVGNSGDVYLTGYFNSATADFNAGGNGGTIKNVSYNDDVFLAKYDSAGNFQWAKGMGGDGLDEGYGVAVDHSDNVYVTGNFGYFGFSPTAEFNPGGSGGTLTTKKGYDVFLAKYDESGKFLWAKSMGGNNSDYGTAVTVDGVGNAFVTGYFISDTIDFNPGGNGGMLNPIGISDVFLAKYDENGNFRWAKGMGGSNLDYGYGVVVDGLGNIFGTGGFSSDTADFNPGGSGGKLTTAGGEDAFLLKLGCSDTTSSHLTISLKCGDSYTLNDSVYTSAGTYIQKLPNSLGCDSTIYLNLTFIPIGKPIINVNGFTLGVTGNYVTYQWLKDSMLIPGATGNTYTVTANGNYQVVVGNDKGCTDTSEAYTVNNYTGIKDINALAKEINVYPNPAADKVNIQSPVKVDVTFTGITGEIIRRVENAHSISIKNLAAGLYLLRITDKSGTLIKVEKVVKQEK